MGQRRRLEIVAQTGRRLTVDRSFPGSIKGLSVITTGPALGHGFEVTEALVADVARSLDGVPGRWTHGGLSDDGLARHLGHWSGGSVERVRLCRGCQKDHALDPAAAMGAAPAACPDCHGPMELAARAVGDFRFSASAHKIKPDGLTVSAPDYLLERATEDPSSLGVSIVGFLDLDEEADPPKATLAAPGPEQERPLLRADFVGDPAANPVGLHAGTGAPSELSSEAWHQLDKIVDRVGRAEARTRALAFLDRYFKEKPMPTETTTPEATDLRAELESAKRALAERDAELAARKKADVARREKAGSDYLASLKARGVELGSPIPEESLGRVKSLLDKHDDESAGWLGEAYVALAEARGTKQQVGTVPALKSSERSEQDLERELDERAARVTGRKVRK